MQLNQHHGRLRSGLILNDKTCILFFGDTGLFISINPINFNYVQARRENLLCTI